MLHRLFPRLTADRARGAALFRWVSEQARQPRWYREGGVPDTVDGRFAMLATVTALVAVRLELDGDAGADASVALTERFIAAMDTEHREMGLGDPALGRKVRKLVGALARRVELWRAAVAGGDWDGASRESIGESAAPAALAKRTRGLRQLWSSLETAALLAVVEGEVP